MDVSELKTPVAKALYGARDQIIAAWGAKVRKQIKAASDLSLSIIVNTVPAFLDNLAEALSEDHPRGLATEATTAPSEHGGERARLTRYGPDQFILEYKLLRETLLEFLQPLRIMTDAHLRVIYESFDQAVQRGMSTFFLVHNRLREQVVAGLGHDLRNPLAAAKMSAELIKMTTNGEPNSDNWEDVRKLAQRIVDNTKRADRLIQEMLDATVIQFGERLPLHMAHAEILSIVRDSINDLSSPDRQRIEINGRSVWGYWDAEAIRRAIENLISNAIKYGKPGTKISIKIEECNTRLILSVHNEGDHIPIEEQESLFQAFRRSQSAKAGNKRGWGLGLALVRSVAEGHGGSIAVDSMLGSGTTFVFDIPVDSRPHQGAPRTE